MNKEFWKSNVGEDKKIRSHILSVDRMKELGFTHYLKDAWYFCSMVGEGVSLNIVITDDESFIGIKVFLEEHLAPLSREEAEDKLGEKETFSINEKIICCLKQLERAGVREGYSV